MSYVGMILVALALILASTLWRVLVYVVWRPYTIRKKLKKQGVEGPKYKLWSGSVEDIKMMKKAAREIAMDIHSHDFIPKIHPHYLKWISQYGETFLYWFGLEPRIFITDPEMVKQVLSNKFGFVTMSIENPAAIALMGKGLVLINGSDWARHRRVVSPAFATDKLKVMSKKMTECTISMLDSWHDKARQDEGQQIVMEVNRQFQELTADVISHTAFGKSYVAGKEVFLAQKELQFLVQSTILNIDIPGSKYLPTSNNRRIWKLKQRLKDTLMRIIQDRLDSKASSYGNDLLGLMMDACRTNSGTGKNEDMKMNMDEIMDECKTLFFAGHEPTSHLLAWSMFLLSTNPEWQDQTREEVIRECGSCVPNADMLSKLKLVNLVLLETLRLYCPVLMISRKTDREMNIGNLTIPKGFGISMPIALIHRSKEVWGADAGEFNPLRFKNGIAKAANHPNAFLSFSIGPRACVGQNFALMEAKMVIAMILQRFSFSASPEYKHAPFHLVTLQPQFGLPIVLRPLEI